MAYLIADTFYIQESFRFNYLEIFHKQLSHYVD